MANNIAFDTNKKFLDYDGLKTYHAKLMEYIADSQSGLAPSKDYLYADENNVLDRNELTIGNFEIKEDRAFQYTLTGDITSSDYTIYFTAEYDQQSARYIESNWYDEYSGDKIAYYGGYVYDFIITEAMSSDETELPSESYIGLTIAVPAYMIDNDYGDFVEETNDGTSYISHLDFTNEDSYTVKLPHGNMMNYAYEEYWPIECVITRSIPFALKKASKATLNGKSIITEDILANTESNIIKDVDTKLEKYVKTSNSGETYIAAEDGPGWIVKSNTSVQNNGTNVYISYDNEKTVEESGDIESTQSSGIKLDNKVSLHTNYVGEQSRSNSAFNVGADYVSMQFHEYDETDTEEDINSYIYFNKNGISIDGKNVATTDQIPSKTSQLSNDSGFITSNYVHDLVKGGVKFRGIFSQIPTISEAIFDSNLIIRGYKYYDVNTEEFISFYNGDIIIVVDDNKYNDSSDSWSSDSWSSDGWSSDSWSSDSSDDEEEDIATKEYILSIPEGIKEETDIEWIELGDISPAVQQISSLRNLIAYIPGDGEGSAVLADSPNLASGNYSHAEGDWTVASGNASHAEGYGTNASGWTSHAEGWSATASGAHSHAEGYSTEASSEASHAEGYQTEASSYRSHAEGSYTEASGEYGSHAEGSSTTASGDYGSHAEGSGTTASGDYSHAEGNGTDAFGEASHAEGELTTASGYASHAEGYNTQASGHGSHAEGGYYYIDEEDGVDIYAEGGNASGLASHAEGIRTTASGEASHAGGCETTASGSYSHAGGYLTTASGDYSHAEGYWAEASGSGSHAEGGYYYIDEETGESEAEGGTASGLASHAEGIRTTASGLASHAGGCETTASGSYSHAEGYGTTASGLASHAEGRNTTASGKVSHAEGTDTTASGDYSHAEGYWAEASGSGSHAEGGYCYYDEDNDEEFYAEGGIASGNASHAEGVGTTAYSLASHAEGYGTEAEGVVSHAEGTSTFACGSGSHAEGYGTEAFGDYSHAEGYRASTCGDYSHAEGEHTITDGSSSHAEGYWVEASGLASHAEGLQTTASGSGSHAEGRSTTASGYASHAGGCETTASGDYSFAHGVKVTAANEGEIALGKCNISRTSEETDVGTATTIFTIGTGEDGEETVRRNSLEVHENGTVVIGDMSITEREDGWASTYASVQSDQIQMQSVQFDSDNQDTGVGSIVRITNGNTEISTIKLSEDQHRISTLGINDESTIINSRSSHREAHDEHEIEDTFERSIVADIASGIKLTSQESITITDGVISDNDEVLGTSLDIKDDGLSITTLNKKGSLVESETTFIVNGAGVSINDEQVATQEWVNARLSSYAPSGSDAKLYQSITWTNLKNLRDNANLVPGTLYRITDYVTTTSQQDTISAGHRFDIVVIALSESVLSEEAFATYNITDGYFDSINIGAWKLWYCLDNDTSRFTWADVSNGKGVIYRMIDDKGNDLPYDFKNIQYVFHENIYEWGEGASDISMENPMDIEYYMFADGSQYESNKHDVIVEFDTLTNPDGVNALVLFKTDINGITGSEYEEDYNEDYACPDYADAFFHVGRYELDGSEYDMWRKAEMSEEVDGAYVWCNQSYGTDQYILTQIITVDISNNEYHKYTFNLESFNDEGEPEFEGLFSGDASMYPLYNNYGTMYGVSNNTMLANYTDISESYNAHQIQHLNWNIFNALYDPECSTVQPIYGNKLGQNSYQNTFNGFQAENHLDGYNMNCSLDMCMGVNIGFGTYNVKIGLYGQMISISSALQDITIGDWCSYIQMNGVSMCNIIGSESSHLTFDNAACIRVPSKTLCVNFYNIPYRDRIWNPSIPDSENGAYLKVSMNSNGDLKTYCEADLIA